MDNNKQEHNKKSVSVTGMHCSACAKTVEKIVSEVPGVESISVNAMTGQASINYDKNTNPWDEAKKRLAPMGYGIVTEDGVSDTFSRWKKMKDTRQAELKKQKKRLNFLVPVASVLLILMLGKIIGSRINPDWHIMPDQMMNTISFIASIAVLYLAGKPFIRALWLFIIGKDANMDTLIGLGTIVAFIYSAAIFLFPDIRESLNLPAAYFFDVVVIVITFVYLGKYLEHKTKTKAGEAIEKLIGLQAKTALVIRDGKEIEVPVEELKIGEIIKVRAGEKIPSDGTITEGSAYIDEAMINGEPMPQEKKAGDKVIGGTINQNGSLSIAVSASVADSFLSKVIEAVDVAQQSKAPGQKLADKISGIFVPAVVAISIATLALWLIIGTHYLGWSSALGLGLTCFISVLAIACPCALGLATPAAIMAGIGAASRKGILIKSAEAVEETAKINTLVFDKTGTITSGKPSVSGIHIIDKDYTETDILGISAALESGSTHPIAQAIIKMAKENGAKEVKTDSMEIVAGSGVEGVIGQDSFFIGKAQDDDIRLLNKKSPASTVIALHKNDEAIAVIEISDTIKPEAKDILEKLKRQGLEIVMLSGDRQESAEAVAKGLAIDKIIAGVSPIEKADYIKQLKEGGKKVAMIGDGINDSVALAEANVGIAMDSGSDIALESAQIALLRGDLNLLPLTIDISQRTVKTMKQNLFWAFFYNVISIPLAAGLLYPIFGWLLSPEIAALAMSFSSVSVVTNALTLKRRYR